MHPYQNKNKKHYRSLQSADPRGAAPMINYRLAALLQRKKYKWDCLTFQDRYFQPNCWLLVWTVPVSREEEKRILDEILGKQVYDNRIRPSGTNGTGW